MFHANSLGNPAVWDPIIEPQDQVFERESDCQICYTSSRVVPHMFIPGHRLRRRRRHVHYSGIRTSVLLVQRQLLKDPSKCNKFLVTNRSVLTNMNDHVRINVPLLLLTQDGHLRKEFLQQTPRETPCHDWIKTDAHACIYLAVDCFVNCVISFLCQDTIFAEEVRCVLCRNRLRREEVLERLCGYDVGAWIPDEIEPAR